ncbi:MAG: hypothetical protein K2X43_15755 [Hyphomonadaceae bacterium]|jgi:hypothetical protein|nr:hypothetical protein [Hyphomonadaceae bacterium]
MRVLMVTSILGCIAGAAIAQTSSSQAPAAPPADRARAQPGKEPADGRAAAKAVGTPNGRKTTGDALASCLAMWDRKTHMSKQDWGRTCRRVANRLENLTMK